MKNLKLVQSWTRLCIAFTLFFIGQTTFAQENVNISSVEKETIFKNAISLMRDNYIFAERVKKIESTVGGKLANNGYKDQTKLFDFLEALNKDFESAGNDHHLNIFYGPEYVKKIRAAANNTSQATENVPAEFISMIRYENFFLKKIERIDGNIGYFKFNKFEELQYAKEGIASAMNFISHSSTIILDLTQNGGGSAETVHFLMNYFLPDSTRLGVFKRRVNNEVIELWTTKDPIINKIPDDVPLYIIVSKNTSSAAEALAYGLQQFGRATIIGEQTHGEGNPGKRFVINDILYIMIPTATNTNSKTGTNWEGTGVIPDIKIEAGMALTKAISESYTLLEKKTTSRELKQLYQWKAASYQSKLSPQTPSTAFLTSITGKYGEGASIVVDKDVLYFVTKGGKYKMTYMSGTTFEIESKEYRLKFSGINSPSDYYEAIWMDGGSEKSNRVFEK